MSSLLNRNSIAPFGDVFVVVSKVMLAAMLFLFCVFTVIVCVAYILSLFFQIAGV